MIQFLIFFFSIVGQEEGSDSKFLAKGKLNDTRFLVIVDDATAATV